ncbi:hypothetical protein D9M71_667720 [compost metagenome]
MGKVAEAAGNRLVDHHLAQLAHDEERHQAGNRVPQQHGRAGHLNGLGNAQKQAGTDGATQGNQLDMAIFQPAL